MKKGFLSFILHAHLPYVRHPEHESFFEENWLFEAITECYIPLINVFDRLYKDKVKYRITLSLSPTLITMLGDELLQKRYQNHLQKLIELAEKEIIRTRNNPQNQKLARHYKRFYLNVRDSYKNQYQCDLLSAFKKHYQLGQLELITTAATHGFLPLLNISEAAVCCQIKVGLDTFKEKMGFAPTGFWLPECGYYPGLEKTLEQAGINYFFVDTHGVMNASVQPVNNVYAPIDCGNGVMAFARDPESSQQVWSAGEGYPGNSNYREYYSDIGFELDKNYISPYILNNEKRINTGIKYHQISNKEQDRVLYNPREAQTQIKKDAIDFIQKIQNQIDSVGQIIASTPIIVSPYDAELFGHWWFEGPNWLEQVLRIASEETNTIETVTCSDYLKQQEKHHQAIPAFSTWGEQGYCSFWLNEENEWIYPFLYKAAEEMEQLVLDFKDITVSARQKRALNQALRSLLLAQSSDWPFIMKSGTTTDYANKRITDQLARFNYLHDCIRRNKINEEYLLALEIMDNIFPNIDFRQYSQI
ncbi:MAG: DUF1957 domain-containing protein [Methylococcales symbiont of Hymedesmia sp. n. MRB-2018]|nr:MAG: DUF1957 domain-containing protein [Methylococcales symbiont of Hymedesmia sp. n. MRB-2018]KAF3984503.1 MAG: DUF1957 domain-containing protein [Methylococcales symbiont of Hymedesmia sp. n. MRB-2018]